MTDLTARETELVALGAALGSNCVPCVEFHIPQARKAGLTYPQIQAAIQLADKVRQVPAGKVLDAATKLLGETAGQPAGTATSAGCGCGAGAAAEAQAAGAAPTLNAMASMMSKMMASCSRSHASNE